MSLGTHSPSVRIAAALPTLLETPLRASGLEPLSPVPLCLGTMTLRGASGSWVSEVAPEAAFQHRLGRDGNRRGERWG